MTVDETASSAEIEGESDLQQDGFTWGKLIRFELFAISWVAQCLTPLVPFLLHPLAPIVGVAWIVILPIKITDAFEDVQPRLLAMTKVMSAIALLMSASLGVFACVASTLSGFGVDSIWMWVASYASIALLWLLTFLVPFPIRREFTWPEGLPFLDIPDEDGEQ
ncbi:MAG: hypothetical protein AAF802_30875 [Planctomycetota bacterium]